MATKKIFAGNGMSRTAMVFKIAMVAGHKLTVPEMNRIKDINPRALEQVYNTVLGGGKSRRRAVCASAGFKTTLRRSAVVLTIYKNK